MQDSPIPNRLNVMEKKNV